MTMKSKKPVFTSVEEYIAAFPDGMQKTLKELRSTIRMAAPQAEEKISYGIPAFTMNGRYLIYFAGWKNHISLYPIPAGDPAFNSKIAPYISGKGTLKFPLDQPLPLDLVAEMVRLQMSAHLEKTRFKTNYGSKGERK